MCLVLYFSFYLTRIRNGRTAIRAALDFDTWRVLYITSGLKASDATAVPEDVSFFLLFFFLGGGNGQKRFSQTEPGAPADAWDLLWKIQLWSMFSRRSRASVPGISTLSSPKSTVRDVRLTDTPERSCARSGSGGKSRTCSLAFLLSLSLSNPNQLSHV